MNQGTYLHQYIPLKSFYITLVQNCQNVCLPMVVETKLCCFFVFFSVCRCGERACQYKFSTEDALQIHVSCHAAVPVEKADGATAHREFECCVCSERYITT